MRKLAPQPILVALSLLLAAIVHLITPVTCSAGTVDAYYQFRDYTDRPLNVRRVVITPIGPSGEYDGSFLSQKPINYSYATYPSLTNGYLLATNLITGYAYRVAFSDGFGEPTVTNYFGTNLSGTVGAVTNKTSYIYWQNGVAVQINGPYFNATITNSGSGGGDAILRPSGSISIVTNATGDHTPIVNTNAIRAMTSTNSHLLDEYLVRAAGQVTADGDWLFGGSLTGDAISSWSIAADGDAEFNDLAATNIIASSLSGPVLAQFPAMAETNQSVFNIVDYGARTNAHMALQICLDKAGTNNGGGGVCFIPAGDWYITNSSFYPTLSSENLESMLVIIGTNVTVKGVGPASKIIVDLGTLASRNVFGSGDSIASGGGRVNWTGAQNVTFMDFTLDSQQNGGDQTQFYGGHSFKFINVRSLNSGADFIDTESVNTTAIGCYVSNAIGSAFQTKPSTSATAQGIIVGCDFVDNSSAATAPTIQILNNVSIACDNVDIGGPKNLYSVGVLAGGQFSFNNCYFYPTNGGQVPLIIVGGVGSFSDCTFYGAGSTTSSNYIYVTNSTLSVANGIFYSKDAIWANDSRLNVSLCKFPNSVTTAITMRGNSSGPWGSKISMCDFFGGSATALDSSVSHMRFVENSSVDRNVLITGGTNNIVANNTMVGTASTRITSSLFNEIRDNIMPVNSGSVHSIMLTTAHSNTIAGNKFGKLTFNGSCLGNELTDNRIESFAYIGGASSGNSLNTGTRLRNMSWTNTFLESSFSDGSSLTNLQATNLVGAASRVLGFDASGIGTNLPTTGTGGVVLSNSPNIYVGNLHFGSAGIMNLGGSSEIYIAAGSSDLRIGGGRDIWSFSDNSKNLGASDKRWLWVYSNNIQASNAVTYLQSSLFPTSSIPLGSTTVTNLAQVPWRGYLVTVATNRAVGGWMWQTNGPSGAPVWGAFNPATQP